MRRTTKALVLILGMATMLSLVTTPVQAATVSETQASAVPALAVTDTALRTGMSGPAVSTLQKALLAAKYWVKSTNGVYDATTQQAVMALQKVAKLPRTGVYNATTAAALARTPVPAIRSRVGLAVEINKSLQVITVVRDGIIQHIVNTSTGTSATPTPAGTFKVYNQFKGPRRAPLGTLYWPKYFLRGYAIHGSPSIPGYPASHGCSRVHNAVMDMLWRTNSLPLGGTVLVYA